MREILIFFNLVSVILRLSEETAERNINYFQN